MRRKGEILAGRSAFRAAGPMAIEVQRSSLDLPGKPLSLFFRATSASQCNLHRIRDLTKSDATKDAARPIPPHFRHPNRA